MNDTEAATLVSRLVAFFPGTRFDIEHAKAFESGIRDLGVQETSDAIEEVVRSAHFIPPVAAIRAAVMGNRKRGRMLVDQSLRLPEANSSPTPAEWKATLERQLEASARHQAKAEKWYAERGKSPPPDPAKALLELAAAGARGDDVRGKLRRTVLNQQESAAVEEQEELDRRHP